MIDLFGVEITEEEYLSGGGAPKHLGPIQAKKRNMRYRISTRPSTIACKNCVAFIRGEYHDKRYFKCAHIGCSHSEATDIRAGHVCDLFRMVGS